MWEDDTGTGRLISAGRWLISGKDKLTEYVYLIVYRQIGVRLIGAGRLFDRYVASTIWCSGRSPGR